MFENKPEVSVIMAVNNGEKYIRQTIESILNQTYNSFEFIIVVNCSTDKTFEIIKEYKDNRIRVFNTNIPQLGFNLNYGLNIANGKYIIRIDADDISDKNRIKKQVEIIEKMNCDVVGSNIELIDEDNKIIGYHYYPENNDLIRKKIWFRSIIAHPSVIYRKDVIIKNGGYLGGRISEDYGLWLRLMRDQEIKFYNIQEPLIKYRIHSGQVKGNNKAYAEVAGLLLTESIVQKKLTYFLGSIRYFLTSISNRWRLNL